MNAVEYLRTLRRMCKSVGSCLECPLGVRGCMGTRDRSAEETIEIVESWAEEHPIRTRQTEFLKRFPNAKLFGGVLYICPKNINVMADVRCGSDCDKCKSSYWLQEVKK